MKWNHFKPVPESLILYGYWRSSASWRVRWALELKEIAYTSIPVNLLLGEHKNPEHLARHLMGLVPVLEISPQKVFLHQSMAILEWIEEVYHLKNPSLFPGTPLERAKIRSLCEIINSDTAPLQSPRTQKRFSSDLLEQKKWAQEFILSGLGTFQHVAQPLMSQFSVYDQITAADLFLIPQIYNALRYEIAVEKEFPQLFKIYENALKTSACLKSSPQFQSDAREAT